jgi:hypothetical protein
VPCLFLAQNSLTTHYTQKASKSSLPTMDFTTPTRTKTNNTCHNTGALYDPRPPILPPSLAPLRTWSERAIGASEIEQEESNHSAFIMASLTPMPTTNTQRTKQIHVFSQDVITETAFLLIP